MLKNRINNYRMKHRKCILLLKILTICYILLFTASYLTSDTSAYFKTQTTVTPKMTFGVWKVEEEQAALSFMNRGNQNVNACSSVIQDGLKNTGNAPMQEAATYEVYYAEKGDPRKNGNMLKEGSIPILDKGETAELRYEAVKPGVYVFKIIQSEGNSMWSKKVTLNCESTDDDKKAKEEKPTEAESVKTEKDPQDGEEKNNQPVDKDKKVNDETAKAKSNEDIANSTAEQHEGGDKGKRHNKEQDKNQEKHSNRDAANESNN